MDDRLTLEPAPLAGLPDGRVLVSVNPTLLVDPSAKAGPAEPDVLQFAANDSAASPRSLSPVWQGSPRFTEHSIDLSRQRARPGNSC